MKDAAARGGARAVPEGASAAPPAFLPPGGAPWESLHRLRAADGVELRAALWNRQGARGHVLLLHGRTEYLEKASLPAAALAARGFAVASVDWRGQGLSARLLPDAMRGHVDDFASYRRDLAALAEFAEAEGLAGPRILLAHSMGGAVALGAVLRGEARAEAVLLSAPMLAIAAPSGVEAVASLLVALAARAGLGHLHLPAPNAARPYVFGGFEDNLLTGDRAIHDWMGASLRADPRLAIATAPTVGWLAAAVREMTWIARQGRAQGLPLHAVMGSAERVVDAGRVRAVLGRLGGTLDLVEGGRHELLIEREELRAAAWASFDTALDRLGI